MKTINFIIVIISVSLSFFLNSCEDAPPNLYVEQQYIEGFLYVDEPVQNIIVMNTQSVQDSFNYKKAQIKDAEVYLSAEGKDYKLAYRESPNIGYFLPDTNYLVKPNTSYTLSVKFSDGKVANGFTKTPDRIKWIAEPKNIYYYPKDSLKLPSGGDSLTITWTNVPLSYPFYILRIKCLDTLEYGKYISPQSDEKNRRIERSWEKNASFYNDVTRWGGPLPTNSVPVVWTSFKWFGKHDVSIIAPDSNYVKWFIQFQRKNQYDNNLASIKNALGFFGSASLARKEFFLYKNQK